MILIAAILISGPVITAAVFFFRSQKANAAAPVIFAAVHLCLTTVLILKHGDFFGYMRVDDVNSVFLAVLSFIFAGVSIYNHNYVTSSEAGVTRTFYYTAALNLFAGAMTAVLLSANLGIMWVFIEATTLASAYLIYFKAGKAALEATWKYIFMCSIGIAFAFAGIIFLSAAAAGYEKSLSFDSLTATAGRMNHLWLKLGFVFMVIGFGTKAGLAPVHAWLPDAHSEAPSPVSALLSATLLNSAMLAIIRVFAVMTAAGLESFASSYIMFMGLLSVFVAAVYIMRVGNYKRMLAYSSIENMGIIAVALSLGKQAFPYLLIQAAGHSLSKAAFFLTSGNILKRFGVKEISAVSGLMKSDNITAWLWLFSFVMIAGIPPSPLFISEFMLIRIMMQTHMWLQAAGLMMLLTVIIYGMASVVLKMCFGFSDSKTPDIKLNAMRYVPQVVFILVLLVMSLYLISGRG
jgi:hydrogenase-4 component F